MPATSAQDEEEQEGILTKKKTSKQVRLRKSGENKKGSVDQILAMSNSPKVQLSTFTTDNWASPAAASQCSPSSHQLD